MTLKIRANTHVERANLPDQSGMMWQATGDDPAFFITSRLFRKRFVVAHIDSAVDIDPKIYVDRGYGFREADTLSLSIGRQFVILADIGQFGSIRSLRVDPTSFPASFSFDATAFATLDAAKAHIARLKTDPDRVIFTDLGRLPRFWRKIPKPSFPKRIRNDVLRYAQAHYAFASATTHHVPHDTGENWLSIIVPAYNTPTRYLDDLLRSFDNQKVSHVELIISDDGSTSRDTIAWFHRQKPRPDVKFVLNAVNGGIAAATNAGLAQANGRWVSFLDHDDVIAPNALKVIHRSLAERPDANFLYTDELVVDDKLRPTGIMLKPAYDPVLLTGVNYINHFSVYRHDRLREIGYLREGYDGSQDYDLLMRYLEGVPEKTVLHLPYPAYWWRRNGETYSRIFLDKATNNARRAISERFAREGHAVGIDPALTETLHRVTFQPPSGVWPKISIVIPSRNNLSFITRVLNDLFERTDYPDFEVVIIDNGSTDQAVLDLYSSFSEKYPQFSAHVSPEKFNFSRSINRGIGLGSGEHFLILNNDVEIIDGAWLKEMVSCLAFEQTGIVGAKLLYPNNTIQHAGVIVGFGGLAGHWYLNKAQDFGGPMNRLHVRNSMTCVTGAVMLISGDCARAVGAWDEENFAVAYNDVDYCMRAYKAGFRIVWTPFACLYHHESVSRGSDKSAEHRKRFEAEKAALRRLHGTGEFRDPSINPAYSINRSDPSLLIPNKPFKAR